MAYIGNQPTVGNFVKLDAIVTSATATYNLLNGGVAYTPASVLNMIVSLNGVIQEPTTASNVGGFTVSGSTIVFTSALTSLDVIDFILVLGDVLNIGTPSDATVGFSKVTSNLITGATSETSIAGGDSVLIYDDSASALRKMTRTNFVASLGGISNYFSAYDTNSAGVSGDLILSSTFVNTGSNYSTSTGLYTAPSAGDYYFWFVYSRAGGSSSTFAIEKNNSTLTGAESEVAPTANIYQQGTIQIIATLAISDTIGITTVNNAYPDKCFFGGWKIS